MTETTQACRRSGTHPPSRRTKGRLRRPLLAVAAVFLLGNDGLQIETLLRDFEIVAFGAEFDQETDGRLHKWSGPVRFHLDARAGDPELYRSLTVAHLELLAELTGLHITLVGEAKEADVVVVFDRAEQLFASVARYAPNLTHDQVMLHNALCFGQYSHNAKGRIVRGVIGIPSDRAPSAGKLPACIVEETTQVLGLPNDSDEVNPSIFNDQSVLDTLTEHDRVLVRLLYDPRLPAGIGRKEALALARQILRDQRM